MNINLKIGPRYVRQNKDGFRPFQRQTLEAIKNSDAILIFVEAPVGSGKSYIIRNLIQDRYFQDTGKRIILTYPTRILMDAQVGAMRKELKDTAIWPDDDFIPNGINIFNYSSNSLFRYLVNKGIDIELNKSELIKQAVIQSRLFSKRSVIITSPDVLHLLINRETYKSSKRLQNYLQGAIVFFDEFHLYVNLSNFLELIKNLLDGIASKVVLLSATPYMSKELSTLNNIYPSLNISFTDSVGNKRDAEFNFPLDIEIRAFKFTKLDLVYENLKELIPSIPKPAAIIFDSVFRLQHIKKKLINTFKQYKFYEWSGLEKAKSFSLDDKSVVIGTSAIEVGIDMDFKSLITEASYWTSAIQRIGRVGRKSNGTVVILTKNDFGWAVKDQTCFERDVFEKSILQEVLRDPSGKLVSGEMFRGDSYNFLLYDIDTKNITPYNEAIFSMFEPEEIVDDWMTLDRHKKQEILKRYGIADTKIKEIIIHDKIFPFWGVGSGRLRDEYFNVTTKYIKEDGELHIIANEHFIFYGA
ncbi:MAG: type I-D CRISPR-associated helicase Cas3' [Acidobacteriota bacterium]